MRIRQLGLAATLVAAALFATASAASAVEATDTIRRTFTLAPAGGERAVEIENVFGSVHVVGGTGDQIEVVIRQEITADDAAALARAKDEVRLDVEETAGRLTLSQDGPFRDEDGRTGRHRRHGWDRDYEVSWDWEVTLPRDASLSVSTVNGGSVRVENIDGPLDAANVNGDVRLTEVGGRTEAATVNGDVEVVFAETLEQPAEFATVNGQIDLSFPRGFGAELEFTTLHGEVYSDFEVDSRPSAAKVETERGRHGSSYRIGGETVVVLGGGGPKLSCSTVNGDILIRER